MKNQLFIALILVCGCFFQDLSAYEKIDNKNSQSVNLKSDDILIKNFPEKKRNLEMITSASFIYWEAQEDNVNVAENIVPVNDRATVKMKYKFHPGFRVGMGVFSTSDNWLLYGDYTSIYTKSSNSTEQRNVPIWFGTATQVTSASIVWKVDYDMIKLSLSKPFYISKYFIFTPSIGVKAGSIDQRITGGFVSTVFNLTTFNVETDSWLIGPMVELGNKWLLNRNFEIFGNTAFSIFYQKYTKIRRATFGFNSESRENIYDLKSVNSYLATKLGISWGKYTQRQCFYYRFALSYDFSYYWNQNHMIQIVNVGGTNDADFANAFALGDLMLHGITLQASLNF